MSATRAARPRTAPVLFQAADGQWQDRGACRSANPSLFYAPENESNGQRRFRERVSGATEDDDVADARGGDGWRVKTP
jgi:hypothetical protein